MELEMAPSYSEAELLELRKNDAWLPSEATRCVLLQVAAATNPTDAPTTLFTFPTLETGEIGTGSGLGGGASLAASSEHFLGTGDPYYSLLVHSYQNETKAKNVRVIKTADDVSQDVQGLQQLLSENWYRSALNLTHRLLTSSGHGPGKDDKERTCLTPHAAHLWLVRFALLKQTKQYDLMELEFAGFSNFDRPDVYFEYSPQIYGGRKGSIVPFSLRLLYAEFPRFLERKAEALDRLYYLSAVVSRMITNLEGGYTEDGMFTCSNDEYKQSSLALWRRRECRILACCLLIYVSEYDYSSAVETVEQMIEKLQPYNQHQFLHGLLGRIHLKFGDVYSARQSFARALEGLDSTLPSTQVQKATFDAMLYIGEGKFEEAKKLFREALEINPLNITAANNMAVCSLYLGQLDQALLTLDNLVSVPLSQQRRQQRPVLLHDAIIANLTILYEVQSDSSMAKKLALLERLSALPGEPVNVAAVKLQ